MGHHKCYSCRKYRSCDIWRYVKAFERLLREAFRADLELSINQCALYEEGD